MEDDFGTLCKMLAQTESILHVGSGKLPIHAKDSLTCIDLSLHFFPRESRLCCYSSVKQSMIQQRVEVAFPLDSSTNV